MEIEIYADIKRTVKTMLNLNLDHYKDEQMRRRLDSWLVRAGTSSWQDYFKRIKSDDHERSRFRDYLTINVSAFFRDIERWNSLREQIMPGLLKDALSLRPANPGLQIWSAGCSIGAEAFTLAILLDEVSPSRHHSLLATDFDQGALSKAKQGGPFNADEIVNLNPAQRSAYLKPGGPPYFITPGLIKKITFNEHNLFEDPFPNQLDLIVCRNVVIYFTADAKDILYRNFSNALRKNGVLFVGATEIIPRPNEFGLRNHGISFYQKI